MNVHPCLWYPRSCWRSCPRRCGAIISRWFLEEYCCRGVCSHLEGEGAGENGAEEEGVSAEHGAVGRLEGENSWGVAMGDLLVEAGQYSL